MRNPITDFACLTQFRIAEVVSKISADQIERTANSQQHQNTYCKHDSARIELLGHVGCLDFYQSACSLAIRPILYIQILSPMANASTTRFRQLNKYPLQCDVLHFAFKKFRSSVNGHIRLEKHSRATCASWDLRGVQICAFSLFICE